MNLLLFLALLTVIIFGFYKYRQISAYSGSQQETSVVPETIIQDLATEVRRTDPDIFPIETIFVNSNPDGTLSARMLFINTRGYFGVQYDIFARITDGKVQIISRNETLAPNMDSTFQPFKPDQYTPFIDIKTAVLESLNAVKN